MDDHIDNVRKQKAEGVSIDQEYKRQQQKFANGIAGKKDSAFRPAINEVGNRLQGKGYEFEYLLFPQLQQCQKRKRMSAG